MHKIKKKLLVFLIAVSSLNILNYSYNISLVDMFPKLTADEVGVSTLLFEHPKTGFSILLIKGDKISLDTYQGLYEEFIFEYYDDKEGEIIISKEIRQYKTPLNEINYIHINPSKLNVLRGTALIASGGALGAAVGFYAGCLAGFKLDPNSLGLPAALAGATLGGWLGGTGGLVVERNILRGMKSVKIQLSGNNAWEVNSIVIPLNNAND